MSARVILLLALCCSSSSAAAAAFMMGGLPKPLGPPSVVDVPAEFRTSSRPWGPNRKARKNHNRGKLDSPQAWSAIENKYGNWYQMDNGKIADISGVAIKGRMNSPQSVSYTHLRAHET